MEPLRPTRYLFHFLLVSVMILIEEIHFILIKVNPKIHF